MNDYSIIKIITTKMNQLAYNRNVQFLHRRMVLLSVLLILFVFFLFFPPFRTSSNEQKAAEFRRRQRALMYKARVAAGNDEEPIIFSKYEQLNQTRKPSENVIAFLVASFTGDARLAYNPYPRLREKILQLDERFDDKYVTDVIVFHTGYPFKGDVVPIIENSRREVLFVNIDHIFYKFSPGFDPHATDPTWTQKGKWHYHHMCYFWFKQVFELKIIQRYRYMMRLDDDSQILGKWPNVFDIMIKRKALYLANKKEADLEYVLPGLTLIQNFTVAYTKNNKIIAQNPNMLADVLHNPIEIPHFWNNFEIVDLSFMQQDNVIDFIEAVDESRGIFLYRWGDAPLRYITLALFTNSTQILHRRQLGLYYCHPC